MFFFYITTLPVAKTVRLYCGNEQRLIFSLSLNSEHVKLVECGMVVTKTTQSVYSFKKKDPSDHALQTYFVTATCLFVSQ